MVTLQATKDIRKVSLWLGHASVQTTEIYTRTDPSEKLEAIGSLTPPTSGAAGSGRPTSSSPCSRRPRNNAESRTEVPRWQPCPDRQLRISGTPHKRRARDETHPARRGRAFATAYRTPCATSPDHYRSGVTFSSCRAKTAGSEVGSSQTRRSQT